jgi:hypothetical protein
MLTVDTKRIVHKFTKPHMLRDVFLFRKNVLVTKAIEAKVPSAD